ncbi:hypothetical protein [Nocardia gipuzkoensis]|uniref:hypothetical protein n=1 Tax=Nocardia gipuzkoensis TaxID=2749991 RepID=UPI00237DD154|nr:hypothetical protein [Nocardia gipuzkoensis]MDE1673771.1 hypothetical protein [Nocardia gipuzkoensis]
MTDQPHQDTGLSVNAAEFMNAARAIPAQDAARATVLHWLQVVGYLLIIAVGLAIGLTLAVLLMWNLTLLLGSVAAAAAGIVIGAGGLAGVVWHVLRG